MRADFPFPSIGDIFLYHHAIATKPVHGFHKHFLISAFDPTDYIAVVSETRDHGRAGTSGITDPGYKKTHG